MKKYIKPELNVENIFISNNIAAGTIISNMPHINNFDNSAETITWENLFGEQEI